MNGLEFLLKVLAVGLIVCGCLTVLHGMTYSTAVVGNNSTEGAAIAWGIIGVIMTGCGVLFAHHL